jgi:coproporphyrinogen III oxidase
MLKDMYNRYNSKNYNTASISHTCYHRHHHHRCKNVLSSKRIKTPFKRQNLQQRVRAQNEDDDFVNFLFKTQRKLCEDLERLDKENNTNNNYNNNNNLFCDDKWEREDGSYGRTRVFTNGDLFEKAAVNVSVIRGILTKTRAETMSSRGRKGINADGGQKYNACALSLVWHPKSPHVPTFRADVRRFAVETEEEEEENAWYGGGMDLTPYYLNETDVKGFHERCRNICDEHQSSKNAEKFGKHSLYKKYKTFCDEYFYIPARLEHRGVGGLFFDDVVCCSTTTSTSNISELEEEDSVTPSDAKAFTKVIASSWLDVWKPIANRNRSTPITEEESIWHQQRRGRYLEFNLLYDRGVKFGLDGVTPDRFESIMVSAPPRIRWDYKVEVQEGSREAKLLEVLRNPINWV